MIDLLVPIFESKIDYKVDLLIPASKNSPRMSFNTRLNEWSVSGKSYPQDVKEFYAPLIDWVDALENSRMKSCTFRFNFEFLNTATNLVLVKLLLRLKEIKYQKALDIKIKWYYELDDDDMLETGESMMDVIGIPFEIIPYEE